jgi:hypothetical protein
MVLADARDRLALRSIPEPNTGCRLRRHVVRRAEPGGAQGRVHRRAGANP